MHILLLDCFTKLAVDKKNYFGSIVGILRSYLGVKVIFLGPARIVLIKEVYGRTAQISGGKIVEHLKCTREKMPNLLKST